MTRLLVIVGLLVLVAVGLQLLGYGPFAALPAIVIGLFAWRRAPAEVERRANEASKEKKEREVKAAEDERDRRLRTNALDDLNAELRRKRGG